MLLVLEYRNVCRDTTGTGTCSLKEFTDAVGGVWRMAESPFRYQRYSMIYADALLFDTPSTGVLRSTSTPVHNVLVVVLVRLCHGVICIRQMHSPGTSINIVPGLVSSLPEPWG